MREDHKKSLIGELDRKAEEMPERALMQFEHETFSFMHFKRKSRLIIAVLTNKYGVSSGSYVGVMSENSIAVAMLIFALARIGAIWVPLNTKQRGKPLRHILHDSDPTLVVSDTDYLDIVRPYCGKGKRVLSLDAVIKDSVAVTDEHARRTMANLEIPDATSLLSVMYTSGTTGPPKGVAVTHRMMEFALRGIAQLTSLRPNDIFFQWEPFYHVGGAQMLFLPLMYDVHTAVVKRFSASRFWDQIAQTRSTHFHYLGGILEILLKRADKEFVACKELRIAWGGGCPQNIWKAVETRFGVDVRECYGMTEASSITTTNHLGPVGSVGEPLPWVSVSVVDTSGREVEHGVSGEIEITEQESGVLFDRYINNEQATKKALVNQSFMTGDRGWRDSAGFFYFEGRVNDSVRHKGENVSAWEVETTSIEHPDIESVAMIGVDADVGEQEIHLYASRVSGSNLSESEFHSWLKQKLASYQAPRYITFVSKFERTPSQRIQKKKLAPLHERTWDSEA